MTEKRKAAAKKPKPAAKKKAPAKKAAPKASKSADLKTKPTGVNVDAFIAAVENDTRRRDAKTLLSMMKKITGEKPVMWGPTMIGFGSCHYKYESGHEGDMFAVGFSPRKANMVLYVLGSTGEGEPLLKKLGPHKHGKSCLYVTDLSKVDLGVLEQIVEKSYKATKTKWG
jgi:hypothetical protein